MIEVFVLLTQLVPWKTIVENFQADKSWPVTKVVCKIYNANCGLWPIDWDDPDSKLVSCGSCSDANEVCGGGSPQQNGTLSSGSPGVCGGGCAEVTSFTCLNNMTSVKCTVGEPSEKLYSNCVYQDWGNWCCN